MDFSRGVLGIAPRTSSAVLVCLDGTPDHPRLVDRRQIDLVGPGLPLQPYHAAAGLELTAAAELIERWAQAALGAAGRGVADALQACAEVGCRVVVAGIAAHVHDVPPLAVALRSHPLLHTGEGQLSREVVAEAAAAAGLEVHYRGPRDPQDPGIAERVLAIGRAAGPPWRKEHKLAAVAALAALAALEE